MARPNLSRIGRVCIGAGALSVVHGCHPSRPASRAERPVLAIDARITTGVAFRFKRCGDGGPVPSVYAVVVEELVSGGWQRVCVASPPGGALLEDGEWLYGSRSQLPCAALVPGRTYNIFAVGGGRGDRRFVISDGKVEFLNEPCW
jgi:hypothetical protein